MISSEFGRLHKRLGGIRYLLLSWVGWLLKLFFLHVLGPSRVGFHSSFGDGSEIPEAHLEHVRDVVWANMVFNRWELGDIVMIDNYRVSHGRQVLGSAGVYYASNNSLLSLSLQPYSGQRKVVVSWSEPQLKPSKQAT